MGNDDYGMVIYHILKKLHDSLKHSYVIHLEDLLNDEKTFPIDERYWRTVLKDLINEGYIDGLVEVNRIGGSAFKEIGDGLTLTARGAEYLEQNSLMAKAKSIVEPALDVASLIIKK